MSNPPTLLHQDTHHNFVKASVKPTNVLQRLGAATLPSQLFSSGLHQRRFQLQPERRFAFLAQPWNRIRFRSFKP